jgi:hypothetical protein
MVTSTADLHRVDVGIAVTTHKPEFLIDSATGLVPATPLDRGECPKEVGRRLLRRVVGLEDGHWVVMRHVGVFPGDPLLILYAVEIPDRCACECGTEWRQFSAMVGDPVLSLFLAAANVRRD